TQALPVAWALIPVLVASRHQIDLWVHYFIFLTPALFVLVGLALSAPIRFLVPLPLGAASGPEGQGGRRPGDGVPRAHLALRVAAVALPLTLAFWAAVVQVQQHLLFWNILEGGAMRTV